MKLLLALLTTISLLSTSQAQSVKTDIRYTDPGDKLQVLDVYSPANAKNLPVVFWIHGGGWRGGDKKDVKDKPQAFMDKGFVFVSINYRLEPAVDMPTLVRDVAKAFHWVHDHIADYGGDPAHVLVGGHSAGAQLAALLCTDQSLLKAEGISFDVLIGCIPVDGDTYDIPAIIETEETRTRVHHLPVPKLTHREIFGDDPDKFRDFSAVYHVTKDKAIPPFLILYVTNTADTSAQAQRLNAVLKDAGVTTTLFGARETTHDQLNDHLGQPDDPATKALYEFLGTIAKK